MNYPQTIAYLYSQLPLFTRDGPSAYKADLTNTITLCARINNPQHKFKSVHVAGTNGKGSASHMLAAILQTAGYKTGLYTSPHLKDFKERIRINGQMISEQVVVDFVEKNKNNFEEIKPSFFEMTVALAFDVFAKEKVDIAIIETGLGGRLDSTNIITPLLSVITNIGWDHMNILGDKLQLIAAEKAGIIKPEIPVIIGEYQPEVAEVFMDKAEKEKSRISFASELGSEVSSQRSEVGGQRSETGGQRSEVRGQRSEVGEQLTVDGVDEFLEVKIIYPKKESHNQPPTSGSQPPTSNFQPPTSDFPPRTSDLGPPTSDLRPPASGFQLDLTGTYQVKNLKTVLCAVDELRLQGFSITDEHLTTALSQVKTLTGLHGRWEVLNKHPLTICDTGHNPEGIQEVLKNIALIAYNQLHFVMGVVNDKDISKILEMLPVDAIYYFCKPNIPRGLEAESLKLKAESFGLSGGIYPSVKLALAAAQENAGKNDLVFVGGSTFVVAEVV